MLHGKVTQCPNKNNHHHYIITWDFGETDIDKSWVITHFEKTKEFQDALRRRISGETREPRPAQAAATTPTRRQPMPPLRRSPRVANRQPTNSILLDTPTRASVGLALMRTAPTHIAAIDDEELFEEIDEDLNVVGNTEN